MSLATYMVYVLVAALTIASPGPGIVMTLTNSINFSIRAAIPGILGVSLGMLTISVVAASGVGAIINSSPLAYGVLKHIGAAYLIYLGVKLWKNKGATVSNDISDVDMPSVFARFKSGLFITLLNPKPMVFFVALYPQFIDAGESSWPQFALLSLTFCVLILVIHILYALFAKSVKSWILKKSGPNLINRVSGTCFFGFALILVVQR